MKYEKSESRKMKYRILLWLRLKQRCAFIATEAGHFGADCLGINEKKMIEVEVKTSYEDLRNDFKKHKHRLYTKKYTDGYTQWIPTHFYFAVPASLVDKTKELLEKNGADQYGIIDSDHFDGPKVVKRALALHLNEPNSKVKFILALRMGSELLRFHEAML